MTKLDEANELKIEKPKKHSEISERAANSESFPKAEIQAIQPGVEKLRRNQIGRALEAENLLAEPIMENSAEEPLQSNAITGMNDNSPTSVVSNRIIVKAMVHRNANGEKEAPIISSTPIARPKRNCKKKIQNTTDLDIIEVLPMPEEPDNHPVKETTSKIKPKGKPKPVEKKTRQKNTVKRNKRTKSNKPLLGLEPVMQDYFALFEESRCTHLEAVAKYANQPPLLMFEQNTFQNLDLAARCEASASTPPLSSSSSEHYDWPEIDIEDAKGNKVNIIQNVAERTILDDEMLPTFDEIIPSPPEELQNAEDSVHVKDVGFSLINQILDLMYNNQGDSLTKLKHLSLASTDILKENNAI
ncbi:hypothetical protein HUJ04_007867 [Dendroctonus ponderosae]|nr:hypothetical protein HUJ04_007867 [Dendroctonus ponderosae]